MKATQRPAPYEIVTLDGKVRHTFSLTEADRIHRDLVKQGIECGVYLAGMHLRGLAVKEIIE